MLPKTATILIVDDMGFLREHLRKMLGELGYENTVTAKDGNEALLLLKRHSRGDNPISLVLLDIHMPVKDGLEALKEIRQTKELLKVPVIMITTEAERSKIIEAVTSGANQYLIKPVDKDKLLQRLGEVTASAGQQR